MRDRVARALDAEVFACDRVGASATVEHWRISTETRTYFAKSGSTVNAEEAFGLAALRDAGARVPKTIFADGDLLITAWIDVEVPMPGFWTRLGHEMAHLHRVPQSNYGFEIDNHLGGTAQTNPTSAGSWAEFFWTYRLTPLLERTGFVADGLRERTFALLAEVADPPSLVHGDLWSGNVLCGPHQAAYLIDPAPYRAHREVDLAMSEMFGGFDPKFYAAYDSVYPRAPGYVRRRPLYNLYHLLNHWLLFGDTYRVACEVALHTLRKSK